MGGQGLIGLPETVEYMRGCIISQSINRSHCCDNGRLNAAPKFHRHTVSVSHGPYVDVFNANDDIIYMQIP